MARLIAAVVALLVALAVLLPLSVLVYQGKRRPSTSGQYVALGSSFAAGLGLGPRAPASPIVCMRSTGGYPQQLARLTGLSLVDMTCSGSTTAHILRGGQVFLGPQLAAVGPDTRLVTITTGGNDVGYIGDLMLAAGRLGPLGKLQRNGPQPVETRDFAKVSANLVTIVEEIRRRAPSAKVVLVSYPPVLPPEGTCAALGLNEQMAEMGRQVALRLFEATRAAALRSGALFVDMAAAGSGHDACSAAPWVNGARPGQGVAFHPNAAGAKATAEAVFSVLSAASPPSSAGA